MARTRSYATRMGSVQTARNLPPVVLAFMNRSITICRGFEVNDCGDLTNVGIPLHTGVQAAIAEDSHVTFDPASTTRRTVREVTCRVNGWTDVLDDDTIMDEVAGNFYAVESIVAQPGIGYYPAFKILTLREVSGVSAGTD
jgi:hypothetical protein